MSYYYSNQPDRALAQFKHSLEIDPKHTKTMLNQGIVLAFGKQDLEGATKAWQQVVDLAPEHAGRAGRPPCARQHEIGAPQPEHRDLHRPWHQLRA